MRDGKVKWILEVESDGAIANLRKFDAEKDRVTKNIHSRDKTIIKSTNDVDRRYSRFFGAFRKGIKRFDSSLDTSTDLVRDWNVAIRSYNATTAVIGVIALAGAFSGLLYPLSAAIGYLTVLPALIAGLGAVAIGAAAIFSGIGEAVGDMGKAAAAAAKQQGKLNKQLAGFDEMNTLKEDSSVDPAAFANLADSMSKLSPAAQAVAIALYEVGEAFRENVIKPAQEAAFSGIAEQIRIAYSAIEPALVTALTNIGSAFNGMFMEMSRVAQTPLFSKLIVDLGELAAGIITALTPAIEGAVNVMAGFVTVGSPYVIALMDNIADLIVRWGEWNTSVEGQNTMKTWIDNSIEAWKHLGAFIGSVWNVFKSFTAAASESGYVVLDALTAMMNRFSTWLKTAEGIAFVNNLIEVGANAIRAFSDALAKVGGILSNLIGWFTGLSDATQQSIIKFGIFLSATAPVFSYLVGLAAPITAVVKGLATFNIAMGDLGATGGVLRKVLSGLKNIFKTLLGHIGLIIGLFVAAYTSSEDFRNAINDIVSTLTSALMPVFEAIGPVLQTIFDIIGQVGQILGDVLAPILTALTPVIQVIATIISTVLVVAFNVLGFILNNIVVPAIQILGVILAGIADFIAGFLTAAIELVGTVFTNIFEGIGALAKSIWDGIVAVWSVVSTFFTDLFTGAWDGIKNAWSSVTQWFTDLWDGLVAGVTVAVDTYISVITTIVTWIWKNIIQPVANFFSGLWNGIVSGVQTAISTIRNVWTTVKNWINTNIVQPVAGFFKGLWDGITSGIKGAAKIISDIFDGIINVIKTPLNWIIDGFNTMIKGVNSIKIPDWVPFIGGKSMNLPLIPKLATGGITTGSTLAQIGEAGTEAVLPLDRNTGWMDDLADKIANSQGNGPVQVVVKLGEETIATKVIDLINERTEMSGYNAILV